MYILFYFKDYQISEWLIIHVKRRVRCVEKTQQIKFSAQVLNAADERSPEILELEI